MTHKRDPLGRAFDVLRYLAEHPAPYAGVGEIARDLDAQQSTISRLLSTMHSAGIVERDGSSGGYRVGIEVLRIAHLASSKHDVPEIVRPTVRAVAEEFDETAFFALYSPARHQMIRVATHSTSRPLRYVVRMHEWTEVFRGASGLAILAFLPEAERGAVLTQADALASADEPWLARAELEPFLAQTRERGYAETHGRRIPGAVGIAAPVFDRRGRVLGDLILTAPEERVEPGRRRQMAEAVMRGARHLTQILAAVETEELGALMEMEST